MTDRELFPAMKDANRTFRHRWNRNEELTTQNELDDLTKKSVLEISAMREAKKTQPLSDQQIVSGRLAPQFRKERVKEKRKIEPMFPASDPPLRTLKSDLLTVTSVPRSKSPSVTQATVGSSLRETQAKTKKFPFCKDEVIRTADMKKPRVTSVGVVPANRSSLEIPDLKVLMEGKPIQSISDFLDDVTIANRCDSVAYTPDLSLLEEYQYQGPVPRVPPLLLGESDRVLPKPAILSKTGTTLPIMYSLRQKPPARPMTKLKGNKRPLLGKIEGDRGKSGKSIASSLRSGEITLPDETMYSQYDEAIEEVDRDMENVDTAVGGHPQEPHKPGSRGGEKSRSSSTGSHKSVKALLQEAKEIASPDSDPTSQKPARETGSVVKKRWKKTLPTRSEKLRRASIRGDKGKLKGLTAPDEESDSSSRPRSQRTVDEIITSLRDQSRTGAISDADRRIQEIMERVLSQTSLYLSDTAVDSPSPVTLMDGSVLTVEITEDRTSQDTQEDTVGNEARDLFNEKHAVRRSSMRRPSLYSEDELDPLLLPSVPPPISEELPKYQSSIFDEQPLDEMDIQKAWEDLLAPPITTYEDILSMSGQPVELMNRMAPQVDTGDKLPVYSSSVSFLSSWAPVTKKAKIEVPEKTYPEKTIHHFCTATTDYQLPKHLQGIGRKYHTPSKFETVNPDQPYRFDRQVLSTIASSPDPQTVSRFSRLSNNRDVETRQRSAAAQRILSEASTAGAGAGQETWEMSLWQEKAEQLFAPADMAVEGSSMPIQHDESRLYWTPAPPCLDVPPAKVKDKLFPEYEGMTIPGEFELPAVSEESSESEEEEQVDIFEMDPEDRMFRDRLLRQKSYSVEDLSKYDMAKRRREEDIRAGRLDPYREPTTTEGATEPIRSDDPSREATPSKIDHTFSDATSDDESDVKKISVSDIRRRFTEATTGSVPDAPTEMPDDAIFPVFPPPRRSLSAPQLSDDSDDTLLIPNDFNQAMQEIQKMKVKLREAKTGKRLELAEVIDKQEMLPEETISNVHVDQPLPVSAVSPDILRLEKPDKKVERLTPAEQALAAGRAYVIFPKRKKRRHRVDRNRLEAVENFLATPANILQRSESLPRVNRVVERDLRVPQHVTNRRRCSLPHFLDFDQFASDKKKEPKADDREWVRELWNVWFDQVFPPTPDPSEPGEEDDSGQYSPELVDLDDQSMDGNDIHRRRGSAVSVALSDIESVDCLDDTEENREIREILLEEVQELTWKIDSTDKPNTFHIGRRGAIYRKLGKLKKASEDLNRAIKSEPLLLDAYWHRHLLHLLLGKQQSALDDLTYILKHNKSHAGAYRSMAEVYRKQGDTTMAIVNYTQAIKLNPKDHDTFYKRAEMYEKKGEMRLALEDYSKATKLMPTKTDAIFKHGMYYFENENWSSAINDFTDLLKVEATNSQARMYRGRAYANLGQWNAAVADLSAAIHMDPNNWQALYHRGCLLRKVHAQRALLDFSMSLLIEDCEENLMSYLHRGILYNAMGKPHDAIPDFESVIKLDKEIPSAHINLGLIYMNKFEDYHRAIKKFTAAVKVDPTCVRAYVCRGEAYHKVHDLKNALKDFTRAIHLRPDIHHYYMYRGQLVLELGNLELAAFCVQHASELGAHAGLGEKATQQAVVQSFLKNYDKAVEVLMAETRVQPSAPLFMLLGKTQMKAKQFQDGIKSFDRALALYKPWSPWEGWPVEAAEVYFLIGQCHTETRNYTSSLEALNSAIKIDSNHAEAYYQRGLTRMRLKHSKGLQDFNRALAINPKLFQAFLSRACYYGMKGNYPKGILNCNEALKIQPNSVRAYLYRGALKYHIKAYELAIRDLSSAARVDSSCALAYFNRAVCYHENKQYEKALMDYGIVLLLGDHLALKVLINRGLLYFELEDFTNALYDFKMAAKLQPWDHKIHHTLGLCFHKLNRLEESVSAFTKSLVENQYFLDALVSRGNVYMDYGHEAGQRQARYDYQRALLYDPTFLPARVNLGYSLQMKGNFMQAWKQFTTAITQDPAYRPALEGRGIINLQMSDRFAAFQDINAAINVTPTAELLTNRGVINQFLGDRVNAMRDYQTALTKDSTYALAYFNAANIYFHTRHFKQALEYYDKAIEFSPKDESAHLNRAITKVMLRDAPGALEDFKTAIKLSPYSAHIYFNRGNLFASMAKFDKAEADYTKALGLTPDDPLIHKRRADVRGKLGRKTEAITDYRHAIEIQSQL